MSRHLLAHIKQAVHHVRSRSIYGARLVSTTSTAFNVHRADENVVASVHADCTVHDMTLVQRVLQTSTSWPNQVAIVRFTLSLRQLVRYFQITSQECGITGRKYTYGAMSQLIRRFASALARMGFSKGDVFGIILPNLPEYPIAMLGASGAGMPVTLINPIYTVGLSFHCRFLF